MELIQSNELLGLIYHTQYTPTPSTNLHWYLPHFCFVLLPCVYNFCTHQNIYIYIYIYIVLGTCPVDWKKRNNKNKQKRKSQAWISRWWWEYVIIEREKKLLSSKTLYHHSMRCVCHFDYIVKISMFVKHSYCFIMLWNMTSNENWFVVYQPPFE